MIAISPETRRTMLAKGGTATYTINTHSSSDTNGTYVVVVVADDDWQAATFHDVAAIKIKEPAAQKQGEPNTEREASVTWERQHRRPATVNRAGRKTHPRRRSPWLGAPGREWTRHKTV